MPGKPIPREGNSSGLSLSPLPFLCSSCAEGMEIGTIAGCGLELPRDGGDMPDEQGGGMILSVIWEKTGMGFLEGTGADSCPEGIASRGFARVLLGMVGTVRELWVRMEGPIPGLT